ncbi:MAG: hypothetical protein OEY86_14855 [Nitrospira sp.]|nr:hypothetical protein [Nitrospira sp.]
MSAILLLTAMWLAYPDRNSYGDPSMEELQQSCTTPDGTIVRLYVGNGGATTAFWYTVTATSGFLSREKQIIFSYSSPDFSSVTCTKEAVVVASSRGNIALGVPELTALRANPRVYHRGSIEKGEWWSTREITRMAFSAMLALIAAFLLRPFYYGKQEKVSGVIV